MRFRLIHLAPASFEIRHGSTLAAHGDIRCYHGVWTLRAGYVFPEYRGNGLQKRLIRARVEYARSRGAKRVTVWVNPRNSYSLNNLIASGFTFMHREPRSFDGEECIGLEKVLKRA